MAFGLLTLAVGALALTVALTGTPSARRQSASVTSPPAAKHPSTSRPGRTPASFAVGLRVLRLVEKTRTIELPDGNTQPRTLLTYVRYPAQGAPGLTDVRDAPGARSNGPFPLVVFGHGFDVTPGLYARLLQSWARAGYVVAAPVFPLESPDAPGGPDEADLSNQPQDMRFVISSMLAASSAGAGPLAGLVSPKSIAVTGQSDGGDTALAVADDPRFRDPRVDAAIILSGAEIPGLEFAFPSSGPPLLATQGTADTVNLPSATSAFFDAAPPPKYLLRLLGAEHLPPYADQQPQLGIVERVTIAFLNGYLKHSSSALRQLAGLGSVPGAAALLADP